MDGKDKSGCVKCCFEAKKAFQNGQKSEKYVELYIKLWEKFRRTRAKEYWVNFNWLWTRACFALRNLWI